MKRDVEDLLREFIEACEARGQRTTVRVPPPPPVPKELAPLVTYLNDMQNRLLSVEVDESAAPRRRRTESQPEIDTGMHRVDELRAALADARERAAIEEERRHSSMTWRKRTNDTLVRNVLLSIIGALMLAIAALTLKLIESPHAPAPRQEEHPR